MTYQIIEPPFTLKFREMSERELADYAQWLRSCADGRIAELESAVRATSGYEAWSASCTPDSLDALGEWFARAVSTRERTPQEKVDVRLRGDLLMSVPDGQLTNESFSLAMDIGLYLARTLERTHRNLIWKQFLDNKKFADYGQPVLTGFGAVPLNPIRIAVTLAYGLVSGRQNGARLREIFDYWSKQAAIRKH